MIDNVILALWSLCFHYVFRFVLIKWSLLASGSSVTYLINFGTDQLRQRQFHTHLIKLVADACPEVHFL